MIAAMPRVKPSTTGQGHIGDHAAKPEQAAHEHDGPAQQRHERHRGRAVLRHDRGEHHGHGPGGPADLHVRPAEHRGDDTGHHRCHEPDRGPDAGADAERQSQRQGDDAHRDARQEIRAQGPGPKVEVGTGRHEIPYAHALTERRDQPGAHGHWPAEAVPDGVPHK
jgi:hypothetical protein